MYSYLIKCVGDDILSIRQRVALFWISFFVSLLNISKLYISRIVLHHRSISYTRISGHLIQKWDQKPEFKIRISSFITKTIDLNHYTMILGISPHHNLNLRFLFRVTLPRNKVQSENIELL